MEYIINNLGLIFICLSIGSIFGYLACALISVGARGDELMEFYISDAAKTSETEPNSETSADRGKAPNGRLSNET